MDRLINFIREEYGQGIVEMALILPILLTLLVGTIEVGRIFGSYMVVGDLARQGARYGIVGYSDNQINDLILSQRAWLNSSNLSVGIAPEFINRNSGDPLQVTVSYSINLLTPFFSNFISNPIIVSSQCTMRIE